MSFVARSCASCDEVRCDMHSLINSLERPTERVSWVLDTAWPETASMVSASFGAKDQFLTPGISGGWPQRYRWPVEPRRPAGMATVRRHWTMRRVARATGAARQRAYLDQDRVLARRLAKAIDYRARHLVVAQTWLPWLEEAGALGGRTFDVVMSRYPLGEIHRLLDAAASEMVSSLTIADFRAPADLVEREAELLSAARQIYTPHYGIAAMFPEKAVRLGWHLPAAKARKVGNRVAFMGPTIARNRPDIAARLAAGLDAPLIVFGSILEPLWGQTAVERRVKSENWLDDVGAILHPAALTHEPRALLEARAHGVTVYATETCGLDPSEYLPVDRLPGSRT
jgi:hypothetical protein